MTPPGQEGRRDCQGHADLLQVTCSWLRTHEVLCYLLSEENRYLTHSGNMLAKLLSCPIEYHQPFSRASTRHTKAEGLEAAENTLKPLGSARCPVFHSRPQAFLPGFSKPPRFLKFASFQPLQLHIWSRLVKRVWPLWQGHVNSKWKRQKEHKALTLAPFHLIKQWPWILRCMWK